MKSIILLFLLAFILPFQSCQDNDLNESPGGMKIAAWDLPMQKCEALSVHMLINSVDTITAEQTEFIQEWVSWARIENAISGGTVFDYFVFANALWWEK